MTDFPKAVLFDLDGTLADTVGDIRNALNRALALRGIEPFGLEAARTMVGAGAKKLIERALLAVGQTPTELDVSYLRAAFSAAYQQAPYDESILFPNALETLKSIRAEGRKLGVVTNKPHELSMLVLEGLDVADRFDVMLGASDTIPLKPAGDMIHAVAGAMGLTVNDVVMVGDSENDVGAARSAGCPVVILRHGYSDLPPDELEADVVISNFAEWDLAMQQLQAK